MKIVKIIIASVAAAFLLAGCGVVDRSASYVTGGNQLIIQMDQLEYIGESEISVNYDKNFGITRILKINGADYDPAVKKYGNIGTQPGLFRAGTLSNKLDRAAYKVYEDFPQAEYFIVVRQQSVTRKLFLGRSVEAKAVVRAYKFK